MYVVDITRTNDEIFTDIIVGKNSMDTKKKIMNYIIDFMTASYNICIDYDLLDQSLNIELFSLNDFMMNNYNICLDKNLIIQSMPTDKDHCLIVKYFNELVDETPIIYLLNKNQSSLANSILTYHINDDLIDRYQDDLSTYEKIKDSKDINSFPQENKKSEIISLYNGGLFLEELLNNACSLKQLNNKNFGESIDI